jgi:dolichyl-phosphate beta-glucosyltransferase
MIPVDDSNLPPQLVAQHRVVGIVVVLLVTLGLTVLYVFQPALAAARRRAVASDLETLWEDEDNHNSNSHNSHSNNDSKPLLSIVIPAYNEELRLTVMLQAAVEYLSQKDCPALTNLATVAAGYSPPQSATFSSPPLPISVTKAGRTALVKQKQTIEWILVNDGSLDRTVQVYEDYVSSVRPNCRRKKKTTTTTTTTDACDCCSGCCSFTWKLLNLQSNAGKGAAVQAGMLASQGAYALMVDADGATDFGPGLLYLTLRLLLMRDENTTATMKRTNTRHPSRGRSHSSSSSSRNSNNNSCPMILFGSRAVSIPVIPSAAAATSSAHPPQQHQVQRSVLRTLFTQAFHWLVVVLVGAADIQDTQCGFKLFARDCVYDIFHQLHLQRWAFDLEVLHRAYRLGLDVQEVGVPWEEVEGSKLHTSAFSLVTVAISMLRDMLCVRLCYSLGLWKVKQRTR